MQFFNLFSFVVVASYAAALPQPAGLSSKYSNNADTNLAFGLEARSYQPVLNSQKDSATSVLLKRQDDSEGSPPPATTPETTRWDIETPLDKAEFGSLIMASTIDEAEEDYVEATESVKTAAAAVGGSVEKELVDYLKRAIYVGDALEEWNEDTVKEILAVIQSGLGDEEYAKVEPSLKEANEKLTTDASGDLQQVNAAVSAIGETPGSVKPEMETIHAALGRTFDAYKVFFGVLQTQLTRFDAGANIDKYLSEASENLVGFTEKQQGLYDSILQKLETAPSE